MSEGTSLPEALLHAATPEVLVTGRTPEAPEALSRTSSAAPQPSANFEQEREYLWKAHSYTNDYIRFADAKAGFCVGIASAILWALFAAKCHDLFITFAPLQWTPLAWLSFGSFLSLVSSIVFAIIAVRPRLWTHSPKGFIFWQSVVEYDGPDDFTEAFKALGPEDLGVHLAHHLYSLAKVAASKYTWVNRAILTGTAGALFGIAVLLQKH